MVGMPNHVCDHLATIAGGGNVVSGSIGSVSLANCCQDSEDGVYLLVWQCVAV